jgi:hypothetical protein
LAAEEMKKSRRSMEGSSSGTLCFATSWSRDACDACDAGHVNADAVAATKARGATNLIMVVCYVQNNDMVVVGVECESVSQYRTAEGTLSPTLIVRLIVRSATTK